MLVLDLLRGIRIGIATVKGFLDVTEKKAVGITSLETLAYNVEEDGIICSLIDAKNNNVYYGFFEKKENNYKQIGKFEFDDINNMIDIAKKITKKIFFVGNASILYKDMIKSQIQFAEFVQEEKNNLNARNIGIAAYNKRQEIVDSNHIMPVYLRKSNAER